MNEYKYEPRAYHYAAVCIKESGEIVAIFPTIDLANEYISFKPDEDMESRFIHSSLSIGDSANSIWVEQVPTEIKDFYLSLQSPNAEYSEY